jgi:hypothetical protein
VWIPLIASILFWGQSVQQAATRRHCLYRLIDASTEEFFLKGTKKIKKDLNSRSSCPVGEGELETGLR